MNVAMNACIRRRCNWIYSLEYLTGAKRQSTDRERTCPGEDPLFECFLLVDLESIIVIFLMNRFGLFA